jgi:hypothetical protein
VIWAVQLFANRISLRRGGGWQVRFEGFRDVCTSWVVSHDLAEWKDEIAWMSLYFSAAVWASLALCVVYSVEDYLPRHRSDVTVIGRSSAVSLPVMARDGL